MFSLIKTLGTKFSNSLVAPGSEESDEYYDEYEDGSYDDEYDRNHHYESEPVQYQRTQSSRKAAAAPARSSRDYSRPASGVKNNVYGFTPSTSESQRNAESVIMHPRTMEDAVAIGSHVRTGRMCIVDLTGVPTAEAQRIADYLCGISDALDGSINRVNNSIITVSPPCHRVMPDYREESSYDGGFLKTSSDR